MTGFKVLFSAAVLALSFSIACLAAEVNPVRVHESSIPEAYVRGHLQELAGRSGKVLLFVPDSEAASPRSMEAERTARAAVTTAMKNLRRTYVGDNYYGPKPPVFNKTVGSFCAACVWYELLFGEEASSVDYTPLHMELEPDRVEIAHLCAHAACLSPKKPVNVNRRYTPANLDESKILPYTLPDPLITADGRRVRNSRQWMRTRRPELLKLFETEMFGRAPGRPAALHFETLYRDTEALGGKAVRKEVKVHFDNSGEHYLRLLVYTPKDARGPVPAFLGVNFKGNHAVCSDEGILLPDERDLKAWGYSELYERGAAASRWPVEMIVGAGYGVATFYRADVDPDYDDVFENGVHPLFYREGQNYPDPDEWGTIAAWAWGLSRALDYLETDADVDAGRVAVIGHSRLGKTALWAAALDSRFAMAVSNNSGNCGAALSRRRFGETILKVNRHRPQWFCDNFLKYNDNEDSLPFDQHELIALIAPRPVYVASATLDLNADPLGEFLALKESSPVFRLFGLKGLEGVEMPAPDTPVGDGVLGYHIRTGGHDICEYDWEQYLKFADRHLRSRR